MKFIAISDTHGCHRQLDLPKGDILLHAGDVCNQGNQLHVEDFFDWFAQLDFTHKIFVRGNHDIDLKTKKSLVDFNMPESVIQLDNSGININGIHIYGIPFPLILNEKKTEPIPKETNVLISHQPPYSILDLTPTGTSRGDKYILEKVKTAAPQVHLFGHIHASYGKKKIGETQFLNASLFAAKEGRIINQPMVFELQNNGM